MYKKRYPNRPKSEKSKAKTNALLNDLEVLLNNATIPANVPMLDNANAPGESVKNDINP